MSEIQEKLEAVLQQYLEGMEQPDLPFMSDGERDWSARDIVEEIRRGTEFGREQLAVLLVQRKLDRISEETGNATVDDFVRAIEEAKNNPHFIEENL